MDADRDIPLGRTHDPVNVAEFSRCRTIEKLAREQGVRLGVTPAELHGDWPAEESIDDFLVSIRANRR